MRGRAYEFTGTDVDEERIQKLRFHAQYIVYVPTRHAERATIQVEGLVYIENGITKTRLETITELLFVPTNDVEGVIARCKASRDWVEWGVLPISARSHVPGDWETMPTRLRLQRYGKWKPGERVALAKSSTMAHWGAIRVREVVHSEDFWALTEELLSDQTLYLDHRAAVLDAFRTRKLYTLFVDETRPMFKNLERGNPIFVLHSWYMLPCICALDEQGERVSFLWVHPRARDRGFATCILNNLKVFQPVQMLPGTENFWGRFIPTAMTH